MRGGRNKIFGDGGQVLMGGINITIAFILAIIPSLILKIILTKILPLNINIYNREIFCK